MNQRYRYNVREERLLLDENEIHVLCQPSGFPLPKNYSLNNKYENVLFDIARITHSEVFASAFQTQTVREKRM